MEDIVFSRWKRGSKLLFWPNFPENYIKIKLLECAHAWLLPGAPMAPPEIVLKKMSNFFLKV